MASSRANSSVDMRYDVIDHWSPFHSGMCQIWESLWEGGRDLCGGYELESKLVIGTACSQRGQRRKVR